MTNFTIRVELHGVKNDSEKYTELHEELGNQCFRHTITTDAGTFHRNRPIATPRWFWIS